MTKIISALEKIRRVERLKQEELARSLGISQGHFSKVLSGKAPLSGKLEAQISTWLQQQGHSSDGDAKSHRIRELTNSIRQQCMELMHLTTS